MSEESADDHRPSSPLVLRVRQILNSCSKLIEGGDSHQSENSVSELVKFFETISDAALSDPDNVDAHNNALDVLLEIHGYLCSPLSDQEVIDALSLVLPKTVAKFACVSDRCLEIADSVIDRFVAICNPRDMLSILCEALSKTIKASAYVAPLLSGLSKVFLSIQRRHFEQVKVAVPVIVSVLKVISLEPEDGDTEIDGLFDRAVGIANSIHEVCTKLEGIVNEKLRALLGLYVLQIMALASVSMFYKRSSCHQLVSQLSCFYPYCSISYFGLITGSDVDKMTKIVTGEDEDDYMSCLSYVKHGASLSVIWGNILDGVAQAAKEDVTAVKDELRSNQTERWQAVGMLKHIYSFVNLPWELKKHAIDFLLCITDENISQKCDEHIDFSSYMPSLFAALQAIKMVIMYAPDTVLRKLSFDAFKRVLADIPTSQRFDILKALITNSDSSSMIAILIDLAKGEMYMENHKRISMENNEAQQIGNKECPNPFCWNASVLELVEFVLRPPQGGPPSLPEHGDAVLSALNLYRFILITESTGKTNYTGVLSKENLQKAYNEWLLPLRTLVTGIMAENGNDYDQLAFDAVCTLNPVELVLYRCIELVEEKLK